MAEHVPDVPISAEGLLALTWAMNLTVFVFMTLRLWLNRRQGLSTPSIIISDVLVVTSWIFGIATISTDAWKYDLEIQGRSRKIAASESEMAGFLSYICGYLVFTAMWLAKGAFVAYYYHLFPNLSLRLKNYLFFVTAFTASSYTVVVLVHALWCHPIYTAWNGQCNATGNLITLPLWSFLNITTDIFILILPLSVLRSLQLGKRQLAGLIAVFCIGGISIIAALARFIDIYPKIRKNEKAAIIHTYELWACIEITTCQLAVCLPALRAYFRKNRDKKKENSWNNPRSIKSGGSQKMSETPLVEGRDGRSPEP